MNNDNINKMKIGVIGGGSWETALANLLATKGFKISFWVFEEEVKEQIIKERENKIFLPGFSLSENLFPSNNLAEVVSDKELILIVVPSHVMRETTLKIADHISAETMIVSASKGIENKTHLTMSGVLKETLSKIPETQFAVLSGPSLRGRLPNRYRQL